jgi:hypothetical protein
MHKYMSKHVLNMPSYVLIFMRLYMRVLSAIIYKSLRCELFFLIFLFFMHVFFKTP